jgi:hypothetical protein
MSMSAAAPGDQVQTHHPRAQHPSLTADRFPQEVRFRAYVRIAYDRSGRAAQLAEVLPGAFAFGLALEDLDGPVERVAEQYWRDVATGVGVNRALDVAVEGWFHARHRWCRDEAVGWRLSALSVEGCAELLREQAWLIRRASPRVRLADLLAPPPVLLFPDDLTDHPAQNAAWFRVMKRPLFLSEPAPGERELFDSVLRWASRMAQPLEAAICRDAPSSEDSAPLLDRALEELISFLRHTGHRPAMDQAPAEMLEQSRRWHAARNHQLAMEKLRAAATDPSVWTPKPPPRRGNSGVHPGIRRAGALAARARVNSLQLSL